MNSLLLLFCLCALDPSARETSPCTSTVDDYALHSSPAMSFPSMTGPDQLMIICPDDITADCADDIPPPVDPSISGGCPGDVMIQTSTAGDQAGEQVCTTTDAIGAYPDLWSLKLFDLPAGLASSWVEHPEGLFFITYADGTGQLTGKVVANNDPTLILALDIRIGDRRDWADWSDLPTDPPGVENRSYKDDEGHAADGGALWETWDYYEIDASQSTIVGEGRMSGTALTVSHAPDNYQFGWQVGLAANNTNANFGAASWILYEGDIVLDDVTYSDHDGTGDVNLDLECEPDFGSQCAYNVLRTYTATDECGNTASCNQLITIQDNVAPEIVICPADTTVQCIDDVPPCDPDDITATDNCGEVTITCIQSPLDGDGCGGSVTNFYTVTDECGNETVCEQTVTVYDLMPPSITAFPTTDLIDCEDPLPTDEPTFSDNCDDDLDISYEESPPFSIGEDDCVGTTPDGPSLTDWSLVLFGQPSSIAQYWEVHADGLTFTPAPDGSALLSGKIVSTTDPTHIFQMDVLVENKRDWAQWSSEPVLPPGTGNRTYKHDLVPDIAGNNYLDWDYYEISPSSTLTGEGALTGSSIALAHAPADLQFGFQVGLAANNSNAEFGLSSWISYSGELVIDGISQGDIQGTGDVAADLDCGPGLNSQCTQQYERTWVATDDCGNSTTFSYTVTITDDTAPVITSCPGDYSVQCIDDVLPCDPDDITATDNCGEVTITCIQSPLDGDGCGGSVTNFYTVTDECGNETVCEQTVTVYDLMPPSITAFPTTDLIDCEDPLPTDEPTFSDNCDDDLDISYEESPPFSIGEDDCVGTTPDGPSLTDWSLVLFGQPSSISQYWEVHADGLTFTPAPDGSALLSGKIVSTTDPTHIFQMDVLVENKRDWAQWSSEPVLPPGTGNRTYKHDLVPDIAGNNYLDWDYYEISPSSTLTGEGALTGSSIALAHAPADLQFGFQVGLAANNSNAEFGLSSWISYSGELVVDGISQGDIQGTGDVAADLDCGPGLNSQCTQQYERTWVATDDCGNSTTFSYTVTITDDTPPVITSCPGDYSVQCIDDVLPCDPDDITATDNCGEVTITCIQSPLDGDGCGGSVTNFYTVTDECGNETVCEQTVTVDDTIAPVLNDVPADMTVECASEIPPSDIVTATDNCDTDVDILYEETQTGGSPDTCTAVTPDAVGPDWSLILFGQPSSIGQHYLVHADGLSFIRNGDGTADLTGIVVSSLDPTHLFQIDIRVVEKRAWMEWSALLALGSDTEFRTYKDDIGIATDNLYYLDWEYYEIDGTSSSITGLGALSGTSLDVMHAPESLLYGFQVGQAANNVDDSFGLSSWITYSGELVIDGVSQGTIEGTGDVAADLDCDEDDGYEIVRTWTATDDCGNSVSATQVVTVMDVTPPIMENPGDMTITTDDPSGATISFAFNASDNCDPAPMMWVSHSNDYLYPVGQTTTVTALCCDESGNRIICAFDVTVEMEDAPDDCLGDITGDGVVNINDLLALNSKFGTSCDDCPEDLTKDGMVDISDFLALNSAYGTDCNEQTSVAFSGQPDELHALMMDDVLANGEENFDPDLMKMMVEMSTTIDFSIAPNPNSGDRFRLDVRGDFDESEPMTITVLDLTGRQVLRRVLNSSGPTILIETDGGLGQGLYMVSLQAKGRTISKRMIVD